MQLSTSILCVSMTLFILISIAPFASAQHPVEIISPLPNQRVPVIGITLEGRSLDTKNTDCIVLVSINAFTPRQTIPVGPGGNNDFSSWNLDTLTLKEGLNSVIAKLQCFDNPILNGDYSIHLEGVASDIASEPAHTTSDRPLTPFSGGSPNSCKTVASFSAHCTTW